MFEKDINGAAMQIARLFHLSGASLRLTQQRIRLGQQPDIAVRSCLLGHPFDGGDSAAGTTIARQPEARADKQAKPDGAAIIGCACEGESVARVGIAERDQRRW